MDPAGKTMKSAARALYLEILRNPSKSFGIRFTVTCIEYSNTRLVGDERSAAVAVASKFVFKECVSKFVFKQALIAKEKELLEPILQKARKAIEDVASEGNYTYIFDKSVGSILYAKESENILEKVKKKLKL